MTHPLVKKLQSDLDARYPGHVFNITSKVILKATNKNPAGTQVVVLEGELEPPFLWASQAKSLNFPEALNQLWAGKKMARKGWNGKNMWVEYVAPPKEANAIQPYFLLKSRVGTGYPIVTNFWVPSVSDINSADWIEAPYSI